MNSLMLYFGSALVHPSPDSSEWKFPFLSDYATTIQWAVAVDFVGQGNSLLSVRCSADYMKVGCTEVAAGWVTVDKKKPSSVLDRDVLAFLCSVSASYFWFSS